MGDDDTRARCHHHCHIWREVSEDKAGGEEIRKSHHRHPVWRDRQGQGQGRGQGCVVVLVALVVWRWQ